MRSKMEGSIVIVDTSFLTEDQSQIRFMEIVEEDYPDLFPWMHHSPNGGKRSASVGAKMKKMGTKKGFPDLTLFCPSTLFSGWVRELKVGEGKASKDQNEWVEHFIRIGWDSDLCWGLDDLLSDFKEYVRHI